MNRRMAAVLMAVCGVCPLVCAGGTTETGTPGTPALQIADAANVNPRGVFPVVKSPTTITIAQPKNSKIETAILRKSIRLAS